MQTTQTVTIVSETALAIGLYTRAILTDSTGAELYNRRWYTLDFNLGPGAKIGAMMNTWYTDHVQTNDSYPNMPTTITVNVEDCGHKSVTLSPMSEILFGRRTYQCNECGSTLIFRRAAWCSRCGTTENLTFAPDPYTSEVHDDDTKVWECGDCRTAARNEL